MPSALCCSSHFRRLPGFPGSKRKRHGTAPLWEAVRRLPAKLSLERTRRPTISSRFGTFWQSSSTYTASVSDPFDTFYSAVGPTVQSASSTPITAQLFYAKKITGSGSGGDTVTVTYTGPSMGSISLAGVVVVEYSGHTLPYRLLRDRRRARVLAVQRTSFLSAFM